MGKEIRFGNDSRAQIVNGVTKLSKAVKATLGPRGRNVLIERKFGAPFMTKDGVTVAKEVQFDDKFENIGAEMVKEVSSTTNDVAGDGTTTATVLAEAILSEGMKRLSAGYNAIDLQRGINKTAKVIQEKISEMAKPISDKKEIEQVATISANNDSSIGEIIADVIEKVGNEGVITIEESKTAETYTEVTEGLEFDRGYISPYFANPENMICTMENPRILVTDREIQNIQDFLPVLEKYATQGKELFVICEEIGSEAMSTLVVNTIRGILKVCFVKAPGFGNSKRDYLEDIATLTGTTIISEVYGTDFKTIKDESLGNAKKIIVTKDKTTIVSGGGAQEEIQKRVELLKTLIENEEYDFNRGKLQERLGKLTGGVGVIHVGAPTEIELTEKKHRVEDALAATRSAIEEGILPGGGTALAVIANELKSTSDDAGFQIVMDAIVTPLMTIAENAGYNGEVILNEVIKSGKGFDARTGMYVDMVSKGIIDPAKVTRTAIQKAASVAGMMLTTECVIVLSDEEESQPQNQYPMMG